MAGIYIHIPFCKKACNYCNFHFSTSLKQEEAMIQAITQELDMRINYLESQLIETIYWGGGTPSILQKESILYIHQHLLKYVNATAIKEYTMECNPDDISEAFLDILKLIGVTRLSLGIQSFKEADLQYMNRAHNIKQVYEALSLISAYGFDMSIDLIYGIPGLLDEEWRENISKAMHPSINHISAYALTVEPQTLLANQIKKGKAEPLDENQAARQFEILVNTLSENGYEQYEISNFARNRKYAVHNTSYWKGQWYLGLGPSAHSFNGKSRSWNIANNNLYIQFINNKTPAFEEELLSEENQWNDCTSYYVGY